MDKIAAALQRTLSTEPPGHGLFGPADEPLPASPAAAAVRVPQPVDYTRSRVIDIPAHVLERHRVPAAVTNDATADAFRTLRTQLLMEFRKNGWKTLAVTSPNKGAGKSTVALNLAISFAMEVDHTALLVDADLRDPDLRNLLELGPGPGLADYLVGDVPLEDLLVHPRIGNLALLLGGESVVNTSELMRSPMMANLVRELRGRYPERIVVFDVPPVLSGADTLALSAYMDATILLVEECKTAREDVRRACELLRDSNLLGVVLNKSRELPKPDPIKWPKPGFFQRIFGPER
jgi:capsular exopolysaccharide synthesis family protein